MFSLLGTAGHSYLVIPLKKYSLLQKSIAPVGVNIEFKVAHRLSAQLLRPVLLGSHWSEPGNGHTEVAGSAH